MRLFSRIALYAIALTMMYSCSKKVEVCGNGETIPIDFDNYEQLSMDDIISKIEVIELEGNNNSYLVNPKGLQYDNGNFYFRDQHSIFVFNSQGQYLYNTSSRRGRARNEYFAVNDYCVIDGNICIMNNDGKIVVYDSDLNLKDLYLVPMNQVLYYTDFAVLNRDILALSATKGDSLIWNFYSKSKNKIITSCYLSKINQSGFRFGSVRRYINNDSIVLFHLLDNGYSYYTFNLEDLTIYELFHYDLGNKSFIPSEVKKEKITTYLKSHPNDYAIAQETLINNKFILTRFGHVNSFEDPNDGVYRLSFYSLTNGNKRLVNNLFNNEKLIMYLDYMDDNCIISFVNDYTYLDRLYEFHLLDDKSIKILNNVNDGTNGLLIKYYLRDDII